MRTVTINAVRLLSTPTTGFDPTSGTGDVAASYVACSVTTQQDGTLAFTDYQQATIAGTATVPLGPNDTAAAKLQQLLTTILDQEGLTVGTDHAYSPSGQQLI